MLLVLGDAQAPGPLHIDIFFVLDSLSEGILVFGVSALSLCMVCFMFQIAHDHAWDEQMISDASYNQVIVDARRLLGPEVYHQLFYLFDDAIKRLACFYMVSPCSRLPARSCLTQ